MSVRDMTKEQLEEELLRCYDMFRCCKAVLNGEDVAPVVLTDTAELDSDDMELYYSCLKAVDNGKEK